MADGSKPKAGMSGRIWRKGLTPLEVAPTVFMLTASSLCAWPTVFVQMQQSLVASIKFKQYTDALSMAGQSQNLVLSCLAVLHLEHSSTVL